MTEILFSVLPSSRSVLIYPQIFLFLFCNRFVLVCYSLLKKITRLFLLLSVELEELKRNFFHYLVNGTRVFFALCKRCSNGIFLSIQEDEDGHLVVLGIIQDLMLKAQEIFLDHFARLGIFSKVQALAGPPEAQDTNEDEQPSDQGKFSLRLFGDFLILSLFIEAADQSQTEDAKEILPGKAYHWKDWCVCRGRDCLYVWSDAAALELSNGSNGWFRFILDGKLATMYSSGSPEGGADTSGDSILS